MSNSDDNPFHLGADDLARLLTAGSPLLPELEVARGSLDALREVPQTQVVLAQTQLLMDTIEQIPPTSYTLYRWYDVEVAGGRRRSYAASATR